MKLKLLTWNSYNLNSGAFSSYIQAGQLANHSVSVLLVNRANDYPAVTTSIKNSSTITIGVVINSGYDINTYREVLKGVFFASEEKHNLVVEDQNDSNKQYYRSGYPIRLVQEDVKKPNSFYVTIQTEYPYWQLVSPTSDSWDITASGDSDVIANAGNLPIAPIFTITPTVTKTSGYKYWRYVPIYNQMDNPFTLPIDITDGGLDVQSLIDAGKMQANGNDFRIWANGSFGERWLHEMDSDSDPAKCWANIYLDKKMEAAINATIDSDDTTLSFSMNVDNAAFLQYLSTSLNYTLLIESEAVTFNPSNVDLINYQITSIVRAAKNTTANGHASSSIVRYITNDLFIIYGDSDATALEVNDKNEPIFDLSSTNLLWTYTNYYDENAARPGAWKGEVKASRTRLSYYFTDDHNNFVNPSTVLGLAERNSSDFTAGHETCTLAWSFTHPCGITNVDYDAETYATGSWPGIVGLQKLQTNLAWFTVENEEVPSVLYTWETTSRSEDLAGTYNSIRFAIEGTLSSIANEAAMAQFENVITSFDSDNLPVISVGSETSINFFNIKLTNSTTGEYIRIITPCPVGSALTIDCTQKKAYLADGRTVPVFTSTKRTDWLNLAPGNNSLVYEDTGTAGVNIVISHRDKIL